MKFPFLDRFLSKEHEEDFFIALEIKQRSVASLLLQKNVSRLEVRSSHEVPLTRNISHTSPEELIQAADQAISQIESGAPPGTFIKSTIFTVPYEWQEGGKVKKEHLASLKKLCDELELTPVGFLVTIEAVMHQMRERDGALTNVIFLELEDRFMTAYIARAGAIVEIHRAEQTGSLGETAEDLLKQVKSFDVLPGRIIVLRGTHAENLQQELVGRQWKEDLPFLHMPQVKVMDKGFEEEAIIQGVAEQMKLHVAKDMNESPSTSTEKAEDLGFHKDVDVAEKKSLEPMEIEPEGKKEVTSDNIVINDTQHTQTHDQEDFDQDPEPEKTSKNLLAPLLSTLKSPFHATAGIPIGFKLLPLVVLVLLALLVYAYYAFLLKAEVVLYADEKRTQDELPVVLSVSDSTSKDTIRIKVATQEIEGSESTEATGEEITGEKATGEVTVFNKTQSSVSFSSGETLTTDDGLTFVLTDDIEIASTSAFSTSYSNKKVGVEASEFGDEYNIESSSNFTFEDYSSDNYFAKNSDKFSGGTSEELTVVSENDIVTVEEALLESLEKEALQKAEKDISSKETLIPRVISSELTEKEFNNDVGDEASSVTLSATGVFEIGYYEDGEVSNFIKGVSTEDVPDGYVFNEKDSKIDFEEIDIDEDGQLAATAKVTAVHLPSLSKDELTQSISGKTATEAKEIIERHDGTKRFEIVYSRKLPFMPELLPWSKGNIDVILKTE